MTTQESKVRNLGGFRGPFRERALAVLLVSLLAGVVGVSLAQAGGPPSNSPRGIVTDGIDTSGNVRDGVDPDIVKDGIDSQHDEQDLNDNGIDSDDTVDDGIDGDGVDDNTGRPGVHDKPHR